MLIRNIITFIFAFIIAAVAIYWTFKDATKKEIIITVCLSVVLASGAFAWGWFFC